MQPSNINRVIAIFLTGFFAIGLLYLASGHQFESNKQLFPSEATWHAFMLAATLVAGLVVQALTEPFLRQRRNWIHRIRLFTKYARSRFQAEEELFRLCLERTTAWHEYMGDSFITAARDKKSDFPRSEIAVAYFFGSSQDWQKNWAATHHALHVLAVNLALILIAGALCITGGLIIPSSFGIKLPNVAIVLVLLGIAYLLFRLAQVYALHCWQITFRQARLHLEQLEWDRVHTHSRPAGATQDANDATGHEP